MMNDTLAAALDRARQRRQPPPFDPAMARLLRRRAGLSLADVAAAVGVTIPCIGYWERGLRRPRDPRLIAKYVGVLDRLAKAVRRV